MNSLWSLIEKLGDTQNAKREIQFLEKIASSIESMKNEEEMLRLDNENLRSDKRALEIENENLKKDISGIESGELNEKVGDILFEVELMEAALEETEGENAKLTQEAQKWIGEKGKLKRENEMLKNELEALNRRRKSTYLQALSTFLP